MKSLSLSPSLCFARALSLSLPVLSLYHALFLALYLSVDESTSRFLKQTLGRGTEQNLSYRIAGGNETFLQRNLLAPYEIIAQKIHSPVTRPVKNVSAPYS